MTPPTPSNQSSTSVPSAPPGIAELAQRNQWVVHNAHAQNGRSSKVPLRADGLGNASTTDPATWSSYNLALVACRRGAGSGVGYVFDGEDLYVGIDLDNCISEDRAVDPWAQEIIKTLDSYTEMSPSGTGVHIIVRGKLPRGGRHSIPVDRGRVEAYERGRYFTMTGWIIEGRDTIQDRQPALDWLHGRYLSPADRQLNTPPAEEPRVLKSHEIPDVDELRDALSYVPSDHYEQWVRFGLALKRDSGAPGFELWRLWSRKSAKYPGDEKLRKWWDGFDVNGHGNPVHVATIFAEAKQQGWSAVENWEEPIPLRSPDVQHPFPVETLGEPMAPWVQAEAEATQTPLDLVASLVLVTAAGAVARHHRVRVREGWVEPTNLYLVVALPPGERKSAVMRDVLRPVHRREAELLAEAETVIRRHKVRKPVLEKRLASLQKKAASRASTAPGTLVSEMDDVQRELDAIAATRPVRLTADDTTPEQLAVLLGEQGGAISVFSPEGGVFEHMAGLYSDKHATKLDVYLKGHAGDPIRVDRIGRPPVLVPDPALTLGLAVQPGVLRGLSHRKGFRELGLLARFLYVVPKSRVGYRKVSAVPVPPAIEKAYHELMFALWGEHDAAGVGEGSTESPVGTRIELVLSPDARARLERFHERVEMNLRPNGRLAHIKDWGAKLVGAVARIAGVLHVADNPKTQVFEHLVTETEVDRAIEIGEYLIEHALYAFNEMGADPTRDHACAVVDWLGRDRKERVSRRDLHRAFQSRFKRASDLDPVLDLLVTHGYLRRPRNTGSMSGRRASHIYEVHPSVSGHPATPSAREQLSPSASATAHSEVN